MLTRRETSRLSKLAGTKVKKIALVFALALLSAAAAASPKPEKNTTTFDGKERIYYTFAPEKISAPAPLLLLLHGSGRDGMSQIDEWKNLAEKEGLVLVGPNSLNSREWSMSVDRPDFFHEIIEATKAKLLRHIKRPEPEDMGVFERHQASG